MLMPYNIKKNKNLTKKKLNNLLNYFAFNLYKTYIL